MTPEQIARAAAEEIADAEMELPRDPDVSVNVNAVADIILRHLRPLAEQRDKLLEHLKRYCPGHCAGCLAGYMCATCQSSEALIAECEKETKGGDVE